MWLLILLIVLYILSTTSIDTAIITGGDMHKGINIDNYKDNELIYLNKNTPANRTMKSWFPNGPDKNKLKMVKESIFSVTHYGDADRLTDDIYTEMPNATITDATANVGGNTISFAKKFKKVNSIEINPLTFRALKNNIKVYGLGNVSLYNDSYVKISNDIKQDVLFMDPPWGGLYYKSQATMMLFLDNIPIYEILNNIENKPKMIVLKVPNNFDIELFKQNMTYYKNTIIKQYPRYKIIMIKNN